MKKQAHAALILAALFSISSAGHSSIYNVKKFMNTTSRIWTYETTKNTSFLCQVDKVLNITKKSVFFSRSYWSPYWSPTTETLEGTFYNSNLGLMFVGGAGTETYQTEILEFASGDYMCGIFFVEPFSGGPSWRDLRFKDVNETGKPGKDCVGYFNSTKETGYVIYRDYCRLL
ncbi:uncharacterized protein LOC142564654 [Dermacentor variabilis]|uniref:uncharacterized protein LOC142564654 n=1 Tax=Dermacentor variabilis TaxID=34621 RepID=UPI003F5C65C7